MDQAQDDHDRATQDTADVKEALDGWNRYQMYVVRTLEDLKKGQDELYAEVTDMRVDIGQLKVKAGLWGALGGFLPASIMAAVIALIKHP